MKQQRHYRSDACVSCVDRRAEIVTTRSDDGNATTRYAATIAPKDTCTHSIRNVIMCHKIRLIPHALLLLIVPKERWMIQRQANEPRT